MNLLRILVKRLFVLFWAGLVVLIIVSAISLTAARVVFSNATEYRDEVVAWLSEQLQQPVSVKNLDARMQGFQPTLLFRDVRLLDQQGKETLLNFREFRVGIDLWSSLRQRQIMLGLLTVVGADLSIMRDQDGRISVKGMALATDTAATDSTAVENWIFSQPHLTILDSTIYWLDQLHDGRTLRFDVAKTELRNQGDRHQLEGVAVLPSMLGKTIHIAADFTGSGEVFSDWKGKFYLNGLGINLASLFDEAQFKQVKSGAGRLDLELWGEWKNGRMISLQGESGVRNLELVADADRAPFKLDLANARFHWQRDGEEWELDIHRLHVVRDKAWPDSRLRLVSTKTGQSKHQYTLQMSFLRIDDVVALLSSSDFIPAELRSMVQELRPRGELDDLQAEYRPQAPPSQQFTVSGRVHELRLKPWKKIPGVEGITGVVWADAESGVIHLGSSQGQINFPRLARNSWKFEQLNGTLSWRKMAGTWYLSSQDLAVQNKDLEAVAEMEMTLSGADTPPFLDLQVAFRNGNVAHASRYYPVAIMPKNLVNWLDRSLVSGKVTEGKLILHGRLKKGLFPYHKGQGTFEVGFKTGGVRLGYLKDWPRIDSLAAEVVFRGQGMAIDVHSGRIMGASINGTHVGISDYRDKLLTVQGQANGDAEQMLRFLQESPIAAGADPALVRMSVAGQASLNLYVDVPLSKRPVDYRGTVALAENSFQYQLGAGYLEATNINGLVQFDRDGYRAESVDVFIFDRPAKVDVFTSSEGDQVTTRITVDGRVLPGFVARQLRLPLLDRLDGESEFRAELDLNYHYSQPGLSLGLRHDSSLQGITSRLPSPLRKNEPAARPLHIEWEESDKRILFSYGNEIHGDLGLAATNSGNRLERGHIHFGSGQVHLPEESVLRVTGELESFSGREWSQLLSGSLPLDGSNKEMSRLRVDLELDRLHLLSGFEHEQPDSADYHFDPRHLPVFNVDIGKLEYNRQELGHLMFNTRSVVQGMEIEQLVLNSPYMKLSGNAQWLALGNQQVRAELSLSAKKTHTMLEALGFSAMLHGDNLLAEGDLGWSGTPMDFKLRNLHGRIRLNIGGGHVESVKPGAGRLFGLFSLQALPRRLALDFRDLFGKGFRFDSIKGEIRLSDGNAVTRNLLLEGPGARIAVSGRTGYVAKDYDQHILVIPGDGSNLFVAGALAWGPQAGVLIWVAEKLLRLDKVAQYVYHVTGSWDRPVINRGREKSDKAPPEEGDMIP